MREASNLKGKLMGLAEAVGRFVPDGAQVALGGFTVNRNPMALAREIIRQRRRGLHVVCHSHGQALDLLVGAGCVRRLEIAYGGMGRFAPTCVRFRQAAQSGAIEVEDYSNFQMSLRFLAGAMGLPFMPCKSGLETDIVRLDRFGPEARQGRNMARRKLAVVDNPFGEAGDRVVLLPALAPDVTLLHVQYVGEGGTVRIKGLTFADLEQAKAASAVVVTCEEVVPESFLREDPDQNSLPHFLIDAVVPLSHGAHPTACHGFYDYDPVHLNLYKKMAKAEDSFSEYLERWVFGAPGHGEYLDRIGADQLARIKADPRRGYAVGLERR